jgi:hypothetical protein
MTQYTRLYPKLSDEVDVSAGDFWALLLDWPAILDWMRVEGRPAPIVAVTLRAGHELGKVPCSRDITFDTATLPGVIPELITETLLHADPVARVIYYNMEGTGPFGLRNYLATTEIDDLGSGRCRVTCSSRLDLPTEAPADLVKGFIESVYDSIIHDIPATIKTRAA